MHFSPDHIRGGVKKQAPGVECVVVWSAHPPHQQSLPLPLRASLLPHAWFTGCQAGLVQL